jgi:hypothetical protein
MRVVIVGERVRPRDIFSDFRCHLNISSVQHAFKNVGLKNLHAWQLFRSWRLRLFHHNR